MRSTFRHCQQFFGRFRPIRHFVVILLKHFPNTEGNFITKLKSIISELCVNKVSFLGHQDFNREYTVQRNFRISAAIRDNN